MSPRLTRIQIANIHNIANSNAKEYYCSKDRTSILESCLGVVVLLLFFFILINSSGVSSMNSENNTENIEIVDKSDL